MPAVEGALVYRVLEGLASAELRKPCGLDVERLAGARVAPGARLALAGVEGAEADQRDHLVLAQARLHRSDQRVDRALGRRLGNLGGLRDLLDQVGFVQTLVRSLSACEWLRRRSGRRPSAEGSRT